jgi:hypothetical protein
VSHVQFQQTVQQWEEYEAEQAEERERLAALEQKWPGLKAWPGKQDDKQVLNGFVATRNGDIFPGA